MKKTVDAFDYAGTICKALGKGVLLTTKAGDQVNTMTIGWGHIGIEWNTPVFIAFVRESRYTREMLDNNPQFTVNIPVGSIDNRILGVCGSKSGRDMDKIRELGLHLEESQVISVPGIRELPLTLECEVIYRQDQDLSAIADALIQRFYPVTEHDGTRDHHIAFYGKIVNAYLIEA